MRSCPCFVLIGGATRCLSNEGPNSRNSRRHHIQEGGVLAPLAGPSLIHSFLTFVHYIIHYTLLYLFEPIPSKLTVNLHRIRQIYAVEGRLVVHHIQENSRLVILLLSRSHVEGWTDWIRHSQNNMTKHLEAIVRDRGMTRCAHCQINHASKLTGRDASRLHVYNLHEQGCRCIVPATSDTSKLRMHASAM